MSSTTIHGYEYKVWRAPVRAFHWINLATLLAMVATGLCILYENELALPTASRVSFKVVHKWAGYVFAINLALRLAWGFMDGGHGTWSRALPFRRGFLADLRAELRGEERHYAGHSPLGALMVAALLLALVAQAGTGIILAGTDLYHGPFGDMFARWVAAPGVDIATLVPGDRTSAKINPEGMAAMRAFRAPVVATHLYVFYAIVLLSALHVGGVVWTETRKSVGVVSAMITGRKRLSAPADDNVPPAQGDCGRHN